MTQYLELADAIFIKLLRPVIVFFGLSVAFMLAYAIFARAVLNKPVFGIEEVMLLCVMWFYMLGATVATRGRSHLKADFVKVMFKSEKVHRAAALISTVISLIIAIMIVRWSFDLMLWGLKKGQKTPVFSMPQVWSQASLLFTAVFFVLYNLRDLVLELKGFVPGSNYFPRSDDL